jgi:glycosyltransferase involved in cell wall biosynthesis
VEKEMKEPLVSIIIPAHNSGKYIKQCLDSVIAQTYQNWGAIVVYAPSTDDTLLQLKEYCDKRIVVIEEEKKSNCATARNKGIELSKGKYIATLDSDDWWEPGKLSYIINIMQRYPFITWCAHGVIFHRDGNAGILNCIHPNDKGSLVNPSAMVFRKDMLVRYLVRDGYIFDSSMNKLDDADLIIRIRNEPIYFIETGYSHYRWNEGSLSANTDPVEQWKILLSINLKHKYYRNLPNLIKNLLVCILIKNTGINLVEIKKRLVSCNPLK